MDSIMGAQLIHFSVSDISACTQGESDLVWLLPSSPKGEIIGIMILVLSLMATHSEV